MPTTLENYYDFSNKFDSALLVSMPGPADILRQQELLYRISVLETLQMFAKTAPQSAAPKDLCWHYQLVDAYFQNLIMERRYGMDADANIQKQRETARESLLRVIQDYRKRFTSFAPGDDAGCYRVTVAKVIQTVLPVWIQYRQTYTEIAKEAS